MWRTGVERDGTRKADKFQVMEGYIFFVYFESKTKKTLNSFM